MNHEASMPVQEISHRRQWALLWSKTGSDVHGQPVVSPTSVELLVRWNNKESEALDPQGNTIRVDATVVVAADVPVASIIWRGSYEDLAALLPGTGSALTTDVPPSGLYQVVTFDKTLDVKGRASSRTLGIIRWSGTMPTQAV